MTIQPERRCANCGRVEDEHYTLNFSDGPWVSGIVLVCPSSTFKASTAIDEAAKLRGELDDLRAVIEQGLSARRVYVGSSASTLDRLKALVEVPEARADFLLHRLEERVQAIENIPRIATELGARR